MESNIDNFFQSIEIENNSLTDHVTTIETENFRLNQQVVDLEKALEKQKKFHRKYAEDVVVTENLRIQDFKEEKRTLIDENKSLIKANRQLTKELTFYKKTFEEMTKADELSSNPPTNQRTPNKSRKSASAPSPPTITSRMTKSTATSMMNATDSSQTNAFERSHKSSKVLSQISEKLLAENKKLKGRTETLNATIKILKSKNQKLENFKKKIDHKKLKFAQDSDELAFLVNSTESKNKTTFTPEILVKLG